MEFISRCQARLASSQDSIKLDALVKKALSGDELQENRMLQSFAELKEALAEELAGTTNSGAAE